MSLSYTHTRIAYRTTSRKALASLSSVTGRIDKEIMREIRRTGRNGITDDEIERRTGRKHQTISANRRHLVERRHVRDSGRKGMTRSGRKAILWVLA